MFEDFHSGAHLEAARRRSSSLAAAVLLYGGLFGALVLATAAVKKVGEAVEDLPEIIFAPPPPEPPPPAQPQPAVTADPGPRPPVKRPRITPPNEISKEEPTESARDLPASGAAGPVEGSPLGGGGGTGKGHRLPVLQLSLPPVAAIPIASSFANRPRYPRRAIAKGIEGVVVVDVEITEAGTVRSVRPVSGAPELLEMVLRWATSWRYKPANRDGKPVASHRRETIRFRLEDL